jgi:hypothetical protein
MLPSSVSKSTQVALLTAYFLLVTCLAYSSTLKKAIYVLPKRRWTTRMNGVTSNKMLLLKAILSPEYASEQQKFQSWLNSGFKQLEANKHLRPFTLQFPVTLQFWMMYVLKLRLLASTFSIVLNRTSLHLRFQKEFVSRCVRISLYIIKLLWCCVTLLVTQSADRVRHVLVAGSTISDGRWISLSSVVVIFMVWLV